MPWLRAHRYAILFSFAALALLLIAGATSQRSPVSNTGPVIALSAGTLQPVASTPPLSLISYSSPQLSAETGGSGAIPAPPASAGSSAPGAVARAQPGYVPAPMPADSSTSPSPAPSANDSLLQFAYSLTPTSVPVFGSPAPSSGRTLQQQALYDYGNQAGLVVLAFESGSDHMSQVLQNWIDHRSDAASQAAVSKIADGMDAAAAALRDLASVPQDAVAANQGLANVFENAAAKLRQVVAASGSDTAAVDAMKSYDVAADDFTKQYLAVVDLFTLHEVTFGANDPGSAFTFDPSGSL